MVAVETTEAVDNLDEILRVPDLDGIFIGPMDLASSMGHLGDPGIKQAVQVALESGQGIGDRAAEQLEVPAPHSAAEPTSPTASPVVRALAASAKKRTAPIVAALAERGISADASWATTDNKTARTIITMIRRHDSGLVIIGSTGQGRFEGLLGSTGTKLVRHSPASVLVIRG